MATIFKNKVIKNVGKEPVDALVTSPSQRATVIGLSLTNLTPSFVYIDILVQDDESSTGYYLKETVLPANTSLRAVSTGEKLIVAPSNKVLVRSSVDDSVDVIISYVEIV
jgi:hypothetical protein